jgi:D-lactate dehydrogenase
MVPVEVSAGEVICQEGDPGDCMFIVDSGRVVVSKTTEDGTPVDIATLQSGEVVGEMSLFDHTPRSASVRAVESGRLWRLSDKDFNELLDDNPQVARELLESLTARLRRETATTVSLRTSELDRRLKVAFFDAKSYTEKVFKAVNANRYALKFFPVRLSRDTVALACGADVVCVFVNDTVDAEVVAVLKDHGVGLIALRCAGYNNVDLAACEKRDIGVVRVPAYSPHAVAEHAVALMMALNRKIHRAHNRVRESDFSLEGLVGFDMYGKTVGVVGAGKIGSCLVEIMLGFGCRILIANRGVPPAFAGNPAVSGVPLDVMLGQADVLSLHAPLSPDTRYMINAETIAKMKTGVMLINTSRGGLIDTCALIDGLKTGKIGSAGLDVYEEEGGYFFEDFSNSVVTDDVLTRLLTFNNVIVTSHQAFLTQEALENIATTTLDNVLAFEQGKRGADLPNAVRAKS